MAGGGVSRPSTTCRRTPGTSPPNRSERMPFAVLLEVALQPCGWLAAYMRLGPDQRRATCTFRNLGGTADAARARSRPTPAR